jgi:putative ABC transport system substrate-binding protein
MRYRYKSRFYASSVAEIDAAFALLKHGFMVVHRRSVISQTARNNVPAVYWQSIFAKDGGLLSYGPDYLDLFRRAAVYVDRILQGTKPSELAVQLPIKFNMAVNINTAKGLGLVVPQSVLLVAEEVIE